MSTNHHTPLDDAASLNLTTFNALAATIDEQIGDMDDGTHAFSAIDVDGGAIDGTTIGGTTPGAGTFTNIAASGTVLGPTWYVTTGGTNQNINAGANATVEFDTEVIDSHSDFNTGTFQMTPSVEGWYLCVASIQWTAAFNANKLITVQFIPSAGSSHASLKETNGTTAESVMCYSIVEADGATDTIHVLVTNGDSVTRTINGNAFASWFCGWRIQ